MADFQRFFENQNFPILIKDKIKEWPLLKYGKEEWCKLFNDDSLSFRSGFNVNGHPLWENNCEEVKMTLLEFWNKFEKSAVEGPSMYFDYKYMSDILPGRNDLFKDIRWADLEHPDLDGRHSTLWIGSKGANTPCHMDSYGYNLVAQLYGRKLWLLLSPDELPRMKPTRVPYEESSIYSEINFTSGAADVSEIHMYKAILEPGDVLFVPRHWWHYVENLELAISVNTWVPLAEDTESRLEEALVQRVVWSTAQELTQEKAIKLMNPNELSFLENPPSDEMLRIVAKACLTQRKNRENCKGVKEIPADWRNHLEFSQPMTANEIELHFDKKVENSKRKELEADVALTKALINSFCNPSVIVAVKEKFLEQFSLIENGASECTQENHDSHSSH